MPGVTPGVDVVATHGAILTYTGSAGMIAPRCAKCAYRCVFKGIQQCAGIGGGAILRVEKNDEMLRLQFVVGQAYCMPDAGLPSQFNPRRSHEACAAWGCTACAAAKLSASAGG